VLSEGFNPVSNSFFPFEQLGLHRNPFGTLQMQEWATLAIVPQTVETVFQQNTHIILGGKKGRGKTSLLLALQQRLAFRGQQTARERLPRLMSMYRTEIESLDVFVLDEAQRLHPRGWWSLLWQARRGTRLLLASHVNVSWLFHLAGIPYFYLIVEQIITPEHIAAVHNRRIAYFTLAGYTPMTLTDEATRYLWQHYGTNLRAQESLLYDVFQQIQQPESITAAHLQHAEHS
jgi:hypothetical protein